MNMEPLGLLSIPTNRSRRMLKKSSSGVLASLGGSTYARRRQGTYPLACDRSERFKPSSVCTSSTLRSLRPCPWEQRILARRGGRVKTKAFLNILRAALIRGVASKNLRRCRCYE